MRIYLFFFSVLLALPAALAATTEPLRRSGIEPLQLYGPTVLYSVERKGKPIGEYRLDFRRVEDQGLEVDVAMQLQISVFGLFRYDYRYAAQEVWQGSNRLTRLQVKINDDGDIREYHFQRRSDGLYRLEGEHGAVRLGDRLLTSNHWHPQLMQQSQLLNTLTGDVSQLNVELLGEESLALGDHEVLARRYRLGGDLENTLSWYDERGRWLGMEFSARDGSRIRVRLQSSDEMNTREEG